MACVPLANPFFTSELAGSITLQLRYRRSTGSMRKVSRNYDAEEPWPDLDLTYPESGIEVTVESDNEGTPLYTTRDGTPLLYSEASWKLAKGVASMPAATGTETSTKTVANIDKLKKPAVDQTVHFASPMHSVAPTGDSGNNDGNLKTYTDDHLHYWVEDGILYGGPVNPDMEVYQGESSEKRCAMGPIALFANIAAKFGNPSRKEGRVTTVETPKKSHETPEHSEDTPNKQVIDVPSSSSEDSSSEDDGSQ